MMTSPSIRIGCFNLFGILLYCSYYFNLPHGFWFTIDSAIFYFFQAKLQHPSLLTITALMNLRITDSVVFVLMCGIICYYRKKQKITPQRMIAISLVMLLTVIITKQLNRFNPISHVSPTNFFADAIHYSNHVAFHVKDSSYDSFPGDHGLFILIFMAFLLRYFGLRTLAVTLSLFFIFSSPRIIIGAHWFSDIYVGSISIACVLLSWLLITPLADYCIKTIHALIINIFPES